MAGMYHLNELLKLAAEQNAEELRLEPGRPPMMLLQGKVRVLDGPLLTADEVTELLAGVATAEQRRELDLCGDTHFQYATEHFGRFSVRAHLESTGLGLSIKNLGG